MHFAVSVDAWPRIASGERLEHRDLRIGDRVGVVVAIDCPHVRLAAVEIETLNLVQRAFEQIDGLLVQR